ncbi:uncharacterized protein ARMOST_20860 [Armillaria ostoyae]|uniref:Uncharacterized protein n=1 Tax=Armillaria ostoyae TaxID=47428 RepID=A0A284S8H2_ARMOS|nr:uncharacterized protein ARMOST_20860 [Armillaria ostoyae]
MLACWTSNPFASFRLSRCYICMSNSVFVSGQQARTSKKLATIAGTRINQTIDEGDEKHSPGSPHPCSARGEGRSAILIVSLPLCRPGFAAATYRHQFYLLGDGGTSGLGCIQRRWAVYVLAPAQSFPKDLPKRPGSSL